MCTPLFNAESNFDFKLQVSVLKEFQDGTTITITHAGSYIGQ